MSIENGRRALRRRLDRINAIYPSHTIEQVPGSLDISRALDRTRSEGGLARIEARIHHLEQILLRLISIKMTRAKKEQHRAYWDIFPDDIGVDIRFVRNRRPPAK